MAVNEELRQFVKESLEQGLDREAIRNVLRQAGWSEQDVNNALLTYADVDFPVAVPRPRPYLHAREAFLYLISFIALYSFACSFGVLLFGLIDYTFPDALDRYESYPSTGKAYAIASVIVAFPLYLFLMRRLAVTIAAHPERRQSLIRRWLTYLTLVVGAAIILGDLIALLANLLTGDPTLNFFLKVGAVLLIVGPIFGYYLWDMRQTEAEASESLAQMPPLLRGVVIGAVVIIVAAVGYAIFLMGTPGQQRDIRLDRQRVSDLQNIAHNIDTYLDLNETMPGRLEDMIGPQYYLQSIEDPETGVRYEYRVTADTDYELCADFATESSERESDRRAFSESVWDHGAGRTCFQLTAKSRASP